MSALLNKVVFVLDASSSMSHLRSKVVDVTNKLLESLKKEAKRAEQRTEVSIIVFSDYHAVRYLIKDKNIKAVKKITLSDYRPDGMTALRDAICLGMDDFSKSDDFKDEDVSFLLIAVTDGGE